MYLFDKAILNMSNILTPGANTIILKSQMSKSHICQKKAEMEIR